MNFSMCRVCLKTNISKGARLDDLLNCSTVSEGIISVTRVKFLLEDGFPQYVCVDCLTDLKNSICFKERCEKSDEIFRKVHFEKSPFKLETEIKIEECGKVIADCSIRNEDDLSDHCEDQFDVDAVLSENEDSEQSRKNNVFICGICNKTLSDQYLYKRHIKLHKHKYACDVCKKTFYEIATLEKHIIAKHPNPEVFDQGLFDQDCVEILGVGPERVFKCKNCEYKTRRMVHMRSHVIVHTGIKPFRCKSCPKAYTQLGSLQFHEKKVHLNRNLSVPCEVCGKILSSKKHLWSHLKTHSDREQCCPVCSVRLKNEKTLAQHMRRHSGHKNYSCERCAAAFYTFSELCNHKNTHKGEESMFKCRHCDHKVKRKSLLKVHMIKHSSNLPHTCQLCGRMFGSLLAMRTHEKRHADWKMYKCSICITRFSNTKTLRRHLEKVHNESWSMKPVKGLIDKDN